jgi:hypothetical protein
MTPFILETTQKPREKMKQRTMMAKITYQLDPIEHSTNVNANCTIKKAIVSILGDDACSLIKIFPIPTIEQ